MTSVYTVIPARGGSKGIPAKNLQLVGGRSLIARAVDAALAARSVDRVFVSTDDDAIASAAIAAGAEIVRRPPELATDTSSSEAALLHALDALERDGVTLPEVLVMVQCTSPFVTAADIDGTVGELERAAADAAFTAAPTHAFLWRREAGDAIGVNHDRSTRPRRQDREPEFVETGAVYAMRTEGFRAARHRFFGRVAIHEVDLAASVEVDDPSDLDVARAVAPLFDPRTALDALPASVAMLALDFDGVLTDNKVMTQQDGTETVVADRGDGLGIERLRHAGVPVVVFSKEQNPVVAARCAKLGIECVQGVDDKVTVLREYLAARSIDPADVVFVGNDVNDLGCLELVGCGVIVADAHPDTYASADLRLSRNGGHGAVREITDLILAARNGAAR